MRDTKHMGMDGRFASLKKNSGLRFLLFLALLYPAIEAFKTLGCWYTDRDQAAEGALGIPAEKIIPVRSGGWQQARLSRLNYAYLAGGKNDEVWAVHYLGGEKLVSKLPGMGSSFVFWQGQVLATGVFPGIVGMDGKPWKDGAKFKDERDLSLESDGASLLVIRNQESRVHLLTKGKWTDLSAHMEGMLAEESRVQGDVVALSYKNLLRVRRGEVWKDHKLKGWMMAKAIQSGGTIYTFEADPVQRDEMLSNQREEMTYRVFAFEPGKEPRLVTTLAGVHITSEPCAGGVVVHLTTQKYTERILFIGPDERIHVITPRDARGTFFVSCFKGKVSVRARNSIHIVDPLNPAARIIDAETPSLMD